jgi:predicted amidophosphoribosyltransferase
LIHLKELTEVDPKQWLTVQAQRWKCECGAHFSWYEKFCIECGAPLASYSSDSCKDPINSRNR